jgi:hypothetical protein
VVVALSPSHPRSCITHMRRPHWAWMGQYEAFGVCHAATQSSTYSVSTTLTGLERLHLGKRTQVSQLHLKWRGRENFRKKARSRSPPHLASPPATRDETPNKQPRRPSSTARWSFPGREEGEGQRGGEQGHPRPLVDSILADRIGSISSCSLSEEAASAGDVRASKEPRDETRRDEMRRAGVR